MDSSSPFLPLSPVVLFRFFLQTHSSKLLESEQSSASSVSVRLSKSKKSYGEGGRERGGEGGREGGREGRGRCRRGERKKKKKKIICREGVGQSGQKRVEGVTLRPLSWSLISLNHLETIIILFNIFLFFSFFFRANALKGRKKKKIKRKVQVALLHMAIHSDRSVPFNAAVKMPHFLKPR